MRYVGDTSERLLVRLPLREGRYHSLQVPTRYHRRLRRDACASMLVTELHSVVDLLGRERTQPPICAPTPGAERRSVPRQNDCYGCRGTRNARPTRGAETTARAKIPARGIVPQRLRRQNVPRG